ncbi:MAG TPA: hypothetical protein VF039_14610 [Longimicrobiales bacterium]
MLSDRVERPAVAGRGWLLAALFVLGLAAPARAQQDTTQETATVTAASDSIVAASVSVGGDEAAIELGLSNGGTVAIMLDNGTAYVNGESLGTYEQNGGLERSWRAMLEEAAMASSAELPGVLRAWDPPATGGGVGRELDARLEQALAGVGGVMVGTGTKTAAMSAEDSIEQLLARIEEMEEHDDFRDHNDWERSPADAFVHDLTRGFAGIIATLVWLGVLFGLGSALLFFGNGRLERLSQTVRDEPIRSGLIGLAGAFLAIPFYVLVIIALAISILGIPLLIAWAPLFPMLVVLSGIVGWLAVAYGAGDAMVTGKLSARPAFRDAGPFQRMLLGAALLLSPFFLAGLFMMTSVLDWVGGLFFVIGIVMTMLAVAVGFGAVLVRGRDALDRQRERRAERRRAREAAQATTAATTTTATEGTNV